MGIQIEIAARTFLISAFVLGISASLCGNAGAAQRIEDFLRPNSQKYSDRGAKPSTGRSGSAVLSGRALQSEDGQVTLSLDAGTGSLASVQLKVYRLDGGLDSTRNFNSLSGSSFTRALDGLKRGQRLQVQAGIRDVDGSRTDVVTLDVKVRLRPNLVATISPVAAEAMIGDPVIVSAQIQETNGDLGARADCLLQADGVTIDQALGIWVDAGDSVTCSFRHSFDQKGARNLRVVAVNIDPAGEFHAQDNTSIARAISILEKVWIEGYVTMTVRKNVDKRMSDSSISFLGNLVNSPDFGTIGFDVIDGSLMDRDYQLLKAQGQNNGKSARFPLKRLTSEFKMDNNLILKITGSDVAATRQTLDDYGGYLRVARTCARIDDFSMGMAMVDLCSVNYTYPDYPEYDSAYVQYETSIETGHYIYLSSATRRLYLLSDGGPVYYVNSSGGSSENNNYGVPHFPFGTSAQINLEYIEQDKPFDLNVVNAELADFAYYEGTPSAGSQCGNLQDYLFYDYFYFGLGPILGDFDFCSTYNIEVNSAIYADGYKYN